MKTQQCVSCGTLEAMHHFQGRTFAVDYKQVTRQVSDTAGWECRVCGEIEFDHDTDSAERYSKASDLLLEDYALAIGAEIKRIRRKLHLTQKDAVKLLSGGGHNAFSRYERGEVAPAQSLFVLMRLLDRHPHLMAEVVALSDGADLQRLLSSRHGERDTADL
ncbi:type II toxin-antitoxin system MqsA family antitoxin [Pseudomonas sp. R4-84]